MEHLLLKAATTATDKGEFEAVISTASPDRDGDIVAPSAMVNALTKWAQLGKLVPLAWAHTDQVIGHVDPSTVRVENDEVIAKGFIDQATELGQEAWRLVKSGTLSFSFGYLIPKGGATKNPGGRFNIKELDVFEISVVPIAPANNDTRVLGWKSVEQALQTELQEVKARLDTLEKALEDQETRRKAEETPKEPEKARGVDPLRKQAEELALAFASDGLSLRKPPKQVEQPRPEPSLTVDDLKQRMRDEMIRHLSGDTTP